jgi:hypothetical protein
MNSLAENSRYLCLSSSKYLFPILRSALIEYYIISSTDEIISNETEFWYISSTSEWKQSN